LRIELRSWDKKYADGENCYAWQTKKDVHNCVIWALNLNRTVLFTKSNH
jgi:hypothetical protein